MPPKMEGIPFLFYHILAHYEALQSFHIGEIFCSVQGAFQWPPHSRREGLKAESETYSFY